MFYEFKMFIAGEVVNVVGVACDQVVHGNHFVTFGQHPVAEMATEKARPACN